MGKGKSGDSKGRERERQEGGTCGNLCKTRKVLSRSIIINVLLILCAPRNPQLFLAKIKMKRRSIPQKIRFEVFKRDSFTCQYCGAKAPDVVLHVDHIEPIAKGGTADILNLLTACQECNGGKGAVRLSDESALDKSRHQAELLQARREQIEMIAEWHKELVNQESYAASKVADIIRPCGFTPNESGLMLLTKWIRRYGLAEILVATQCAFEQYFRESEETWDRAFNMIPRIAYCKHLELENPIRAKAMLFRGILMKRLSYVNHRDAMDLLEIMLTELGESETSQLCNQARNWTQFLNRSAERINEVRKRTA